MKTTFCLTGRTLFSFMSVKISKDKEGKEHYILIPEKEKEKEEIKPIKKEWWVRIPHGSAFRSATKGLEPSEKWVLVVLMSYRGKEGLICPSLRTLADDTGFSLRWIEEIIKELKKKKYIGIVKEKGKFNTYQILI